MRACAFAVGINEYPARTGLTPLKGAVADAVDFADWALAPNGGGVAPQDLYLWTWPAPAQVPPAVAAYLQAPPAWFNGDPAAAAPTAAQITQSIAEVAKLAHTEAIDRIYVFFAGHGIQVDLRLQGMPPQNCFVTADYVAGYSDGLVPCDDLKLGLEGIGPADVILAFDCCRSELSPTTNRPSFNWPNWNRLGYNERWVAARAAQPGKIAFETDDPANPRGIFSRLLTFALRNLRVEGQLTMKELESYIYSTMPAAAHPRRQVPQLDFHPKDVPFVLVEGAPLDADLPLSVTFHAETIGKTVLLRRPRPGPGEFPVLETVTQISASAAGYEGALPLGKYVLEVAGEQYAKGFHHFGPEPSRVEF